MKLIECVEKRPRRRCVPKPSHCDVRNLPKPGRIATTDRGYELMRESRS